MVSTDKAPSTDEVPSTHEAPSPDAAPSPDETASPDDAPLTDQAPTADEAPATDQAPATGSAPWNRNGPGIPVSMLVAFLMVVLILGLVAIGGWSLSGNIKLNTIPIVGQWQAEGKPWRLELRPDKTVVSSSEGSTEPGVYRVDFFGNLWVTLNNGKIYSANLAPPQNALTQVIQDRFDLVESGTDAVTVFDRQKTAAPAPAN
ncbi:MAG TPA: hypothetical protein VME69_09920 [Methylocella sp.]|nr:hypothetical protein [Methylocella sp.]